MSFYFVVCFILLIFTFLVCQGTSLYVLKRSVFNSKDAVKNDKMHSFNSIDDLIFDNEKKTELVCSAKEMQPHYTDNVVYYNFVCDRSNSDFSKNTDKKIRILRDDKGKINLKEEPGFRYTNRCFGKQRSMNSGKEQTENKKLQIEDKKNEEQLGRVNRRIKRLMSKNIRKGFVFADKYKKIKK